MMYDVKLETVGDVSKCRPTRAWPQKGLRRKAKLTKASLSSLNRLRKVMMTMILPLVLGRIDKSSGNIRNA